MKKNWVLYIAALLAMLVMFTGCAETDTDTDPTDEDEEEVEDIAETEDDQDDPQEPDDREEPEPEVTETPEVEPTEEPEPEPEEEDTADEEITLDALSLMTLDELFDYAGQEGTYYEEAIDRLLASFGADQETFLMAMAGRGGVGEAVYQGMGARIADLEKQGDDTYINALAAANEIFLAEETYAELDKLMTYTEYWRNQ